MANALQIEILNMGCPFGERFKTKAEAKVFAEDWLIKQTEDMQKVFGLGK